MTEPPGVCEPCAEYQRGEREDTRLESFGVTLHVCKRVPEDWWPTFCPCGCKLDH